MELSRSILKEFATVTNGIERPEKTIYLRGTIKSSGDSQYVRIDGSESLTPISEIVDVKEGDRVLVTIENHQATIIGNLTKPPSSYKEDEAIDKANEADGKATDAKTLAESAGVKADTALVDAERASGIANQAKQDAAEAMTAAENASESSNEAKELATSAGQNAATAREEASAAQNAATAAQGEVTRIQGVVTEVRGDIDTALQEVADQAADLQATKETLEVTYAKKTEVSEVQASLTTEISKKVGELQTTVSETYAAKNDVIDLEGRLQSQITQTAGEITTVVGKVEQLESDTTEAQQKVNEALEKSSAAQVAANQAQANATASQAAADLAKAQADTALEKANTATQNAATAAATAAEADRKLALARTDLDEARTNLENTMSRVDATEADILDAQNRVAAAQAAVTQAQEDAAEATLAANNAQTAATQAQNDATEAQNAATNAQRKADNATSVADAAIRSATQAQADVAALTSRVTTAETRINQNAEQITLSATKTEEIGNKLDNLSIGSDNLIINGGFPTDTHGWTRTDNIAFYPHRHSFYFNENKTIFCATTILPDEGFIKTNRFKVKRNTTYALSFIGFAGSNVRSTDVTFLGRMNGESSDFSIIKNIFLNLRMSGGSAEFFKATFNTGDSDEGYIRFDHNGSTDGEVAYMFFGEVMLVEGTVAKKYQPSSVDTQSQIDGINNNLSNSYYQKSTVDSKLTTAVSGITAQYTQDITTRLGNYYDKSTIDSKLTIDGQGISTYVKSTQNQLDNIKVGGRNLLRNTKDEYTVSISNLSSWVEGRAFDIEPTKNGEQYVLSFEAKASENGYVMQNHWWYKYDGSNPPVIKAVDQDGNVQISEPGTDGATFFTLTTEYKRYYIIFDVKDSVGQTNIIVGRLNDRSKLSNTGWVKIKEFKLEKGNKPTAWSPAPEDMATAEQAQNAQNTANTANSKADAIQTQVSSISQKADRIESEVFDSSTGLKTKVTQLSDSWSVKTLNGSGDILSQLNVNGDSVKIKSALIELDGYTTITEAFINRLTANSIVTQTIDARAATITNAAITNLDATNIKSGYLDAQRIKAGSITSDKINVTTLSAITANLGRVTSGYIGNSNGKTYWDLSTGNFFNTNGSNSAVSIGDGKLIVSNKTSFDSSSVSSSSWDSLELGTNRIALGNSSGFLEIRPNTIGIGGSSGSATILSSGGLRFGYDFNATVSWFQGIDGMKDWYDSTGYRLQRGRIDLTGGSINTLESALQLTANTGPVNLQGASANMRDKGNNYYVTCYAANFSSQSAYSTKTDFENIDNITMLQAILKTDIVKYRFKNNPQKYVGFVINDNGHSPYMIDNLLVNDDNSSFSSNTAIGVAYGAIKELNRKLERLEAENFLLQAKLEAIT